MCHKSGKEHIIPDVLSRLASVNRIGHDDLYSKLDTFFTYHTILVKISLDLATCIVDSYLSNN